MSSYLLETYFIAWRRVMSRVCVGVEVPQGVGRFCEVLPANQATVLHCSAAAAARTASQRV